MGSLEETLTRRVSDAHLTRWENVTHSKSILDDMALDLIDERQRNAALVAELATTAERLRDARHALNLTWGIVSVSGFDETIELVRNACNLNPTQAEARAVENARKAELLDYLLEHKEYRLEVDDGVYVLERCHRGLDAGEDWIEIGQYRSAATVLIAAARAQEASKCPK